MVQAELGGDRNPGPLGICGYGNVVMGKGSLDVVFERFTDRARAVLVLAQEEASLLNHGFIGTEHILLGIIHEGDGVGAQALHSLGISLQAVRERVEETIGMTRSASSGSPPFTPRAKKVLELSLREALQMNHDYIGTEHLLLGLVRQGDGITISALRTLGADPPRVRQEVIRLISGAEDLRRAVLHTYKTGPVPHLPPHSASRAAHVAGRRCPRMPDSAPSTFSRTMRTKTLYR